MKTPTDKTPAGMKGGVRRRGTNGEWSFTIDMGLQDAQRCNECGRRMWVGGQRLTECPKCGGDLRSSRERRQVVHGGYPTQSIAKEERAKALVKLGKGAYVAPQRKTLSEYLRDEWVPRIEAEHERGELKATTLDSYKRNVREHLIGPAGHLFPIGQIQLRKLRLENIRDHYDVLAAGYPVERSGKTTQHPALGIQSRRRVHAALHRALNDAIEKHYLDKNPAWRALRTQKNPLCFEGSVWTAEELDAFFTSTVVTPLYPFWFVTAMTGLRRGEVCGLRWSDVDAVAGEISSILTRVPLNGTIVESDRKNHKPLICEIAEDAVAVLERHKKAQAAAQLKAGPKWQDTGYVFTKPNGEPVNPNYVSRAFRLAIEAAELRPIRLHDLRHTHASLLLADGEPIGNVSRRLGHSSSQITAQVYEHYIPGAQRATAEHFQSIMRNAREKAV